LEPQLPVFTVKLQHCWNCKITVKGWNHSCQFFTVNIQ